MPRLGPTAWMACPYANRNAARLARAARLPQAGKSGGFSLPSSLTDRRSHNSLFTEYGRRWNQNSHCYPRSNGQAHSYPAWAVDLCIQDRQCSSPESHAHAYLIQRDDVFSFLGLVRAAHFICNRSTWPSVWALRNSRQIGMILTLPLPGRVISVKFVYIHISTNS